MERQEEKDDENEIGDDILIQNWTNNLQQQDPGRPYLFIPSAMSRIVPREVEAPTRSAMLLSQLLITVVEIASLNELTEQPTGLEDA